MRLAPLADVKAKLSAYLDEVKINGPIVITKNGRTAAILLVPTDDDDLEHLLLTRSPKFQAMLGRSRKSVKAGRTVKHDEFWKTVAERQRKRAFA
ncbi:MAG: type II toxin-antitoxin system Phd/YefM family antitoxin [Anaerolineae bacterium]|nr:type II toxin-antitoxin system Phd/YefM family antitoxin [Anaerolineae bacterium]